MDKGAVLNLGHAKSRVGPVITQKLALALRRHVQQSSPRLARHIEIGVEPELPFRLGEEDAGHSDRVTNQRQPAPARKVEGDMTRCMYVLACRWP